MQINRTDYIICALTTCHLAPPTHRRGPVQLRGILHASGDDTLFEEYLAMAGIDRIIPEQAEQFLADAVAAFDMAIEVYKTSIPYAYKLEPFICPISLKAQRISLKTAGIANPFSGLRVFT